MVPAPLRVVLDANVLFPFTLRDTLLRAAAEGYFQVFWSAQILEEARRNLIESASIEEEQAARLAMGISKARAKRNWPFGIRARRRFFLRTFRLIRATPSRGQ